MRTSGWDIQGIYSRKSKAIHGCKNTEDFVAPTVINEPFPEPAEGWKAAEFPCRPTNTSEN